MELWKKDLIRLAIIIAMITYVCTNCVFSSKMHVVSFNEFPSELQDSLLTMQYYIDKYSYSKNHQEEEKLFREYYKKGLLNDSDSLHKIEDMLGQTVFKELCKYQELLTRFEKYYEIYIDTDYEMGEITFASFIIWFTVTNKSNGKWRTYTYSQLHAGAPIIFYKNAIYIPLHIYNSREELLRGIDLDNAKFGKYTLSTW